MKGSQATISFDPMVGSTWSVPSVAFRRRACQSTIACRSSGVPTVVGYACASVAQASASRMRVGVGSTGDPMLRSTMPSGCRRARSA